MSQSARRLGHGLFPQIVLLIFLKICPHALVRVLMHVDKSRAGTLIALSYAYKRIHLKIDIACMGTVRSWSFEDGDFVELKKGMVLILYCIF